MSSTRSVRLEWTGTGLRFHGHGTEPESPSITIDGDSEAGPSPMQLLQLAAAACAGTDVVLILQKMRAAPNRVTVNTTGERRDDDPRRFESLKLSFDVSGEQVSQEKAERAASLSVEKYCSVLHSLAPDIAVDYTVVVR